MALWDSIGRWIVVSYCWACAISCQILRFKLGHNPKPHIKTDGIILGFNWGMNYELWEVPFGTVPAHIWNMYKSHLIRFMCFKNDGTNQTKMVQKLYLITWTMSCVKSLWVMCHRVNRVDEVSYFKICHNGSATIRFNGSGILLDFYFCSMDGTTVIFCSKMCKATRADPNGWESSWAEQTTMNQ